MGVISIIQSSQDFKRNTEENEIKNKPQNLILYITHILLSLTDEGR